jgi:very-short-patch-repair endonuclease|tara:strand:+ start:120 stop:485 length:366 start_codon:yes stop_codon:yes gene_type:complete
MSEKIKHNKLALKSIRKDLRNNATPAERELWKYISSSKLAGRKFRRQHSINNYIVDFFCFEEKLIIELDGEHHFSDEGYKKDSKRDAALNTAGYKIIRIENKWVFDNLEGVLDDIKRNFKD